LQSVQVTKGSLSTDELDTGRTWEDTTESQSLDTVETNQTGSEIKALVTIEATADNTRVFFTADW